MTFDAKVDVNGKVYDAIECGFSFERKVDEKGAPSSHITNLRLHAMMKSSDATDILESGFSEFKPVKGSFKFLKGDEQAKMKDIEFEEAYVIGYKEEFVRKGETPMCMDVFFTAKKVTCGSAVYEADWS